MRYLFIAILISCSISAIPPRAKYSIVIDAGSTGSRIFVFELKKEGPKQKGMLKEKKTGGIHTAIKDLSKLSLFLDPLINFVKKELKDQLFETPVYFRATGGMRSLQPAEQQRVSQAIESFLKNAGFNSVSVEVISGAYEGIYAWIAANYALKKLDNNTKSETYGIIDMGGVSAQITFAPLETPKEHGYQLELGKNTFDLYSYSYDELGVYSALKTFKNPNCFNHGFKENPDLQGSLSKCKRGISAALLRKDIYQPKLRGDFVALEGFPRLTKIIPLSNFSSSVLDQSGEQLCRMKWSTVQTTYTKIEEPELLPFGCFAMAYYSQLLTAYGFTPTSAKILTFDKIDDQDVSIALGVAAYENWGGKISLLPQAEN